MQDYIVQTQHARTRFLFMYVAPSERMMNEWMDDLHSTRAAVQQMKETSQPTESQAKKKDWVQHEIHTKFHLYPSILLMHFI